MPCARKTQTICAGLAPSAFMMPISRVFCTVTVISVLITPKAATMMMKKRMTNMTWRSMRMASKRARFSSYQVTVPTAPWNWASMASCTRSIWYGSLVFTAMPWTASLRA